MEITDDIRAKVMMQYIGQKIKLPDGSINVLTGVHKHNDKWWFSFGGNAEHYLKIQYCKVILKTQSKSMAFDEEDYMSFKKIEAITGELLKNATNKADFTEKMIFSSFLSYQYSVSRGIDVPQYFLDGKTLEEVGLAIYENKN